MLDLANQHGDSGARGIFAAVQKPGQSEDELLQAMEEESVRRIAAQYQRHENRDTIVQSTRDRRRTFRTSALFSSELLQA